MKIPKVFKRRSWVFLESYKGASGCFKSVSWGIQESFKRPFKQVSGGFSQEFYGSFLKVSMIFQECLRKLEDFFRCFKEF